MRLFTLFCCFGALMAQGQIDIDLLSMFSLTREENGVREVADVSAVFAFVHAFATSKRLESIAPGETVELLPGLNKTYECDVRYNHNVLDTRSDFSVALAELARRGNTLEDLDLVLGPSRSSTCVPVSFVSSTFSLPVFSPSCTSPELDDTLAHRFFARTVPSDDGTALAIIELLKVLPTGLRLPELKPFSNERAQVYSNVAVIYQEDTYGSNYKDSLFENVPESVIDFIFIPYTPGSEESAREAVTNIASRGLNVIIGLFFADDVKFIVDQAIKDGIMTEDQIWIISDGILSAEEFFFGLSIGLEEGETVKPEVLRAVNNTFLVQASGQVDDALVDGFQAQAFQSEFGYDLDVINDILDAQADASDGDLFADIKADMAAHAADPVNNFIDLTDFSLFGFDMVLAIQEYIEEKGCENFPDGKIDGQDFIDTLTRLSFEGSTGTVSFDDGHSRAVGDSSFKLLNVRFLDEPSDVLVGEFFDGNWTIYDDLITFNDGGSVAPLLVDPPENIEFNEIPPEIRVGIYLLGALVIGIAVILGIMTMMWGGTQIIRAAQPFFLILVLVGVVISTLSIYIFPQANDSGGEAIFRCNVPYFFLSLGLTLSYGSLVFKLRRVVHVANQSPDLLSKPGGKRHDTAFFLTALLIADVIIFAVAFVSSPLEQSLRVILVDDFDQAEETFEICSTIPGKSGIVYVGYFIFHLLFYMYGLYLIWKVKDLSTDFQEGKWITLSIISQFQLYLLGIPIVIAVGVENPGVRFMVIGLLVLLSNVVLMSLIFGPKFIRILSGEDKVTWKTRKIVSKSSADDLFEVIDDGEKPNVALEYKRSLMNTMNTDDFGAQ